MNTAQILEALPFRAPKVKEINEALDALNNSHEYLDFFLENNPKIAANVKSNQVADYLLQVASSMIDKRTPMSLVKNVYDEFAIIFAILTLNEGQKAKINKLSNIFITTIKNSAKFDLYRKARVNNMRLSSENDLLEVFWLIPLFVNVSVLLSTDVSSFVRENREIARVVDGYVTGYAEFVWNTEISSIDKANFKQYLIDGIMAKQK